MSESRCQSKERLGTEQGELRELREDIHHNYPIFNQTLAEKEHPIVSKLGEIQWVFSKCGFRAKICENWQLWRYIEL